MKHLWLILFLISSIWGQSLNFTNKDSTIIVKPGQLVNLNGARYKLINTDYDKQQIILETEIPDSAPYKYFREPIEGGFFSAISASTLFSVMVTANVGVDARVEHGSTMCNRVQSCSMNPIEHD